MTRDEARKILGEGATEEQITNMLNTIHTNIKAKEDELSKVKGELNKFSDYDTIKQKLSDIEKENMSAQEKMELDKKEIAENLKKSKLIVSTAKAKEILAGIIDDEDIISTLVTEDLEKTIANATKLSSKISSLKEETKKKTQEDLTNLDVKPTIPNANQNDSGMTWEKYTKLSEAEQVKYANENPTEFAKL